MSYTTYLRDLGNSEGVFFCRAVDGIMTDRRYCSSCPLTSVDDKGRKVCVTDSDSFNRHFPDYPNSDSLLLKAYRFAETAHRGQKRKGTSTPYFVHVMEAASIVKQYTQDTEVIAAAILHDVIEDTGYSYEDLENEFGQRIADLVNSVSEDKQLERSAEESWYDRKVKAISGLATASDEVKMIALGDKLSNIRSTYEEYQKQQDKIWEKFNQKSKDAHGWYYREMLARLDIFADTEPYKELKEKVDFIFGKEL